MSDLVLCGGGVCGRSVTTRGHLKKNKVAHRKGLSRCKRERLLQKERETKGQIFDRQESVAAPKGKEGTHPAPFDRGLGHGKTKCPTGEKEGRS